MGTIITARCKCGYKKGNLRLGGGRHNFKTTCNYPFYCKNCNSIVQVNLLADKYSCPDCGSTSVVSYEDESTYNHGGKYTVFNWDMSRELGKVVTLMDSGYICPACNNFDLQFNWSGNWD